MSVLTIPNPMDCDTEFYSFNHYDVAHMPTEDLVCELTSARCRLWVLKSSDSWRRCLGRFETGRRIGWLEERISRIEAELKKRRYTHQEPGGQRSEGSPRRSQPRKSGYRGLVANGR